MAQARLILSMKTYEVRIAQAGLDDRSKSGPLDRGYCYFCVVETNYTEPRQVGLFTFDLFVHRYSRPARRKRSDGNEKRRRSFQRRSRSRSRSPVSSTRHTRVRRRSASPPRRRPIVITPRVNDRRKGRRTGERFGQRKPSGSLLKVKADPERVNSTPEHRSEAAGELGTCFRRAVCKKHAGTM